MFEIVVGLHVLVSLVIVVAVLLQSGSGGGLASTFGGSGGTDAVFGGRGAATFLSKLTTVLGAIFFITSIFLAMGSMKHTAKTVAPGETSRIREPQPFNPEAQMLIEKTEPPATGETAKKEKKGP
jgi:preprotein translocase subunit SecG